jgi:hypothetical protein
LPPLAAVPDIEQELDELYGLPLEEWTRARNDLASRLKKAHQTEQAEAVRKLRKPSVVAWAVNQLARREGSSIDALLEAGERLRKAQEEALGGHGGAAEVNAAARAEREVVRGLVASARAILEEAGNAATQPTLERLSQTLRAAAVDDAGRGLLAHGRLDEELKGIGFGTLSAVSPAAARRPPRPRHDELKHAREQARDRVTALRSDARRLAKEARAAEADAARAEREAERARSEAAAHREHAERVETELAEAEAELDRLKK